MTLNFLFGRLRRFGLALALGGALGLVSCGGGGGDNSPQPAGATSVGDSSTQSPAPAPETASTPVTATGLQPAATAVGVASGAATSASVGAAGGRVSTADGALVLDVPAGALASDTVISIQPLSNLAHGGRGAAYRLAPEGQTFLKPVKLTFAYTDQDLQGTAADVLGAAFQTSTGHWQWAGQPTLDTTAKTVSVESTHFSVWSMVGGTILWPKSKTIRPKASVALQVLICYAPNDTSGLVALGFKCDSEGDEQQGLQAASDWSVNGRPGGGSFGTVSGDASAGTYTAPAFEPSPNVVAVSATVYGFNGAKTLLVSNITVVGEDSWTGTASFRDRQHSAEVQVTWVLLVRQDNIAQYSAVGVGTIASDEGQCKYPATSGQMGGQGILVVDFNTSPPTYKGIGATGVWNVTRTCTNSGGVETTVVPAGLPFFGGTKEGGESAAGVVRVPLVPDEPMVIEGTDTDGVDGVFVWRFTRNP
jgi:hypothetical protein